MPVTASPRPSRVTAPCRVSGAIATVATSRSRIGVPSGCTADDDLLDVLRTVKQGVSADEPLLVVMDDVAAAAL